MSDWEVVSDNEQQSSTTTQSEWSAVPYEPQEESFLHKLPRNVGAGLANMGHTLLNTPHDLAKNIEQQGQEFGQSLNQALPLEKYGVKTPSSNYSLADQIPYQQEHNFAQMLGQQGNPTFMDTAIQKGVQYAPEVLLGANALRTAGIIPHLTKRGATRTLNKAQKLAEERDIGTLNVNPELIEDARQFLPNILRNRQALDASHAGDYNSLFKLQSEVGQLSGQQAKSWFSPSERIKGRAGLEARGNLLDAIHENLQSLGHEDISNLLRQGQNEYRRYMKFRPYRNMLGATALGMVLPKNALIDLGKKIVSHKTQ